MVEVFVNSTEYYYKTVSSVVELMDNELTVSHIFRGGAFTKSGIPYGEAVAGKLGMTGGLKSGLSILEVGPGLGDVAQGIISVLERQNADFHYTFADISYDVIKHLKSRFKGRRFSFITGDFIAEKLGEKFDFIICNEVLADFPTIVNMTLYKPKIREGDTDAYFDAVSLVKFYGLSFAKPANFNYGAVKFMEKARASLFENGKLFMCEHSSEKPQRIGVFGHSEYTIDFGTLEKIAAKLRFRGSESGNLSELLGVKDVKAVLFYTQPELKMLYNFFKSQGVLLDQRPYEADEAVETLEKNGVHMQTKKSYGEFLVKHAGPLRSITNQFSYLILQA
jgi:hypothetical protein